MVDNTKVNGCETRCMVKVFMSGKTAECTKEGTIMIRNMVAGSILGLMGEYS